MTSYEAMFCRKSIRKFHPEPLGADEQADIVAYLHKLQPLKEGIPTQFRLIDKDKMKKLFAVDAPHYLLAFAPDDKLAHVHVGYQMQQIDLFLCTKGLGACWLGMAKPGAEARSAKDPGYVIALAVGRPAEEATRSDRGAFKRKEMAEITDIADANALFEPVRLAPSAMNGQPWFFGGDAERIRAYVTAHNPIKGLMLRRLNRIDLGIALCHLAIAARQEGRKVLFEEEAGAPAKAGYEYLTTARLVKGIDGA